jgi:hypothetical protein
MRFEMGAGVAVAVVLWVVFTLYRQLQEEGERRHKEVLSVLKRIQER